LHRPPAGDGRGVSGAPAGPTGPPVLIVVLGPTGVGKTELAIEIAERVGGEIVGCDALQVYRGFDAATAKPDASDRLRVRHHLVDCVDPRRDFSLADYVVRADAAITDIRCRGRVPLVVGGTGMYLRGLLRGVVDAPPRDEDLRARLHARLERDGPERLHRLLERFDPETARRVAPADVQRVVRALEVALADGESLGERIARRGTWGRAGERYAALKIGLELARDVLVSRLEERVRRFFEAGLVEEVRRLLAEGVPPEANAFKAIGYRETLRAVRADAVERDALEREVAVRTRQFAKRQRTWFRGEHDVRWFDAQQPTETIAGRVAELWAEARESA
jgi:tRNA dimethylallyltransferase